MRLTTCIIAFLLSIASVPASAFTVDELRDAVAASDFDAVDAGIDAAQAGLIAGEVSADHMRELFIALSRSAPEMVAFVEAWLARDPENPNAQIARAWTLHNAAHFVARGGNEYSYYVAGLMRDERGQLAYEAYQNAPDLIPATDAIVRGLGQVSIDAPHPLEALDKVLNENPNYGTIHRSITSGYHRESSAKLIRLFCNASAASFEKSEQDSIRHRCLIQTGLYVNRKEIEAYVEEHLWTDTDHETLMDRLAYFVGKYEFAEATEEQIAWAHEVMLNYEADQFELPFLMVQAKRFEDKMLQKHGVVTNFLHIFKKAHVDRAERYLANDPFNIDLIDLVEGVRFAPEFEIVDLANGNVSLKPVRVDRSAKEEKAFRAAREEHEADFLLRRLQAMPYSAELWKSVALHLSTRNGPDTIFDGDAALQNAVVFSNDPVEELNFLISRKAMQWETVQKVAAMSAADIARLPNWERFQRQTNTGDQILCPFLRARLLRSFICKMYQADVRPCQDESGEYNAQLEKIQQHAEKLPACAGMLTVMPEELWYEPVDFGEATRTLN